MSLYDKLSKLLVSRLVGSKLTGHMNKHLNRVGRNCRRRLLLELMEDRRLMTVIDLANLTAEQGTRTLGGGFASDLGDVNGDGYDDFIFSGNYLIFGRAALPASIDLSNLGTAGVAITGAGSVGRGGDVNGDGFADLIVGIPGARNLAGESYIVFGKEVLPATINLATLGTNGITIFGIESGDQSGGAVSTAGDVNGDGFDDLIIGAYGADGARNRRSQAGESYVIFGGASLPSTIALANLGTAGVTIYGRSEGDRSGASVGSAGDMNGDGFDDLYILAFGHTGPIAYTEGSSYVIFGGPSLPTTLDLAALGIAGVRFTGVSEVYDNRFLSISGAGDVNGDGFDDLIMGSYRSYIDGIEKSYVIFGKESLTGIDLRFLGSAGITILGAGIDDSFGIVSNAGDVNGDGFDDLIMGAPLADGLGNSKPSAGESYLLFGGPSLPSTIDLSNALLDLLTIIGAREGDHIGRSVTSAGDVNGDGLDDLIIAAVGGSYVIFGGNAFTSSVTHLGTAARESLTGTSAADIIVGGRGSDELLGNGGSDVLIGGQGNDVLTVDRRKFKKVVGGTGFDTLRLNGSGINLNLLTLRDNRIEGIEAIDIKGNGSNILTLNQREVLNLSDTSNTLMVRRDAGDIVNRGPGWTQGVDQVIGGINFETFRLGAARLKVEKINSSPMIRSFPGSLAFKVRETGILIAPNASVVDSDSANFAGGTLTFRTTLNVQVSKLGNKWQRQHFRYARIILGRDASVIAYGSETASGIPIITQVSEK